MARTWSSGSGDDYCQSSGALIRQGKSDAMRSALLVSNRIWVARLAVTLNVGVIVSIWPTLANSPALAVLVIVSFIVVAVAMLGLSNDETSLPMVSRSNGLAVEPNLKKPEQGVRRNPMPVRAHVAPVAAPGAVLARDLDPRARAWADLMARMSHDLRTPLNAVIGFSDLMQREAFGPLGSPRYQEYARHIQDCGAALLKSTEDTLAMTSALTDNQMVGPDCHPVALEPLVRDAWQSVSKQADERGIELCIEIEPGLLVQSEATALRQILVNLLGESLAHVSTDSEGAQLIVRAVTTKGRVEIEFEAPGRSEANSSDSLALCVARTLLHFHGASLLVVHDAQHGWRAVTALEAACQHDFFGPGQPNHEGDDFACNGVTKIA